MSLEERVANRMDRALKRKRGQEGSVVWKQ